MTTATQIIGQRPPHLRRGRSTAGGPFNDLLRVLARAIERWTEHRARVAAMRQLHALDAASLRAIAAKRATDSECRRERHMARALMFQ